MRCVVNESGAGRQAARLKIVRNLADRRFLPEFVLRHDLVELFQFPEAGDIALAVSLVRIGKGKTAGSGKPRIAPQLLGHLFGFRDVPPDDDAHKGFE